MIYTEHSLAKKLQDVSVNEYNPNWNKPKVEKQLIKPISKEKPKKEEKIKYWNGIKYGEVEYEKSANVLKYYDEKEIKGEKNITEFIWITSS